MRRTFCLVLLLAIFFVGCGHSHSSKVGLMSFGDLEGKTIPDKIEGRVVEGEDCCEGGGRPYYLSNATRNALKGTGYDTLIDAEVTNITGLWVWSNCIKVKGKAVDSRKIQKSGGPQ